MHLLQVSAPDIMRPHSPPSTPFSGQPLPSAVGGAKPVNLLQQVTYSKAFMRQL